MLVKNSIAYNDTYKCSKCTRLLHPSSVSICRTNCRVFVKVDEDGAVVEPLQKLLLARCQKCLTVQAVKYVDSVENYLKEVEYDILLNLEDSDWEREYVASTEKEKLCKKWENTYLDKKGL